MAKVQSPLLGFNNNVRHRGHVFHIQTEDSGIKYPHVITHLFADGGRILKSIKTSYAEYLDSENLEETVRSLMKEQHKSMFIALRDGEFDALLDDKSKKGPEKPAATPSQAARRAAPTQKVADPSTAAPSTAAPSTAAPSGGSPVRPGTEVVPPASTASSAQARSTSATAKSPTAAAPTAAAPTAKSPTGKSSAGAKGEVDVAVLERAAAAVQNRSPLFGGDDMPPPPASVLARRPSGSYRAVGSESTAPGSDKSVPGSGKGVPGSDESVPGADEDVPKGRYSATRPASIFGTAAPSERSASVFGEETISGKSLDEVILSFLSEEFGTPPEKEGNGTKK